MSFDYKADVTENQSLILRNAELSIGWSHHLVRSLYESEDTD